MHLSETMGIALIAVGGTLGSGALSYLAARRNTEVQLGGIRSEMERLRATHQEESRRECQDAYYGFVTASHAVKQAAYGVRGVVTEEIYAELLKTFGDEYIRVCFLGNESVVAAAGEMVGVSGKVAEAVETTEGSSFQQRLEAAFDASKEEWRGCEGALIASMKMDLEAMRP